MKSSRTSARRAAQEVVSPPTLKFFSDDTFEQEDVAASVGDTTYLEAVRAGIAISTPISQSLQITVDSALTGDHEIVVAHGRRALTQAYFAPLRDCPRVRWQLHRHRPATAC